MKTFVPTDTDVFFQLTAHTHYVNELGYSMLHRVIAMGPLIKGTPLRWDEIQGPVAEKIRSLAVHQFMRQWRNRNNSVNKQPIWGDEVSFTFY